MTQAAGQLSDQAFGGTYRRSTVPAAVPATSSLTEVGARLSPVISEAFDMMRAAIAATRESADGVLTITTIPTFAANWLVPRLGSFQLAQPALAVRLQATRDVD